MKNPLDIEVTMDLRHLRAEQLTAHIMYVLSPFLRDEKDWNVREEATRELFKMLYTSGAEIITDRDRANAGLGLRNENGLTDEELRALEARRLEQMLHPTPYIVPHPENHVSHRPQKRQK